MKKTLTTIVIALWALLGFGACSFLFHNNAKDFSGIQNLAFLALWNKQNAGRSSGDYRFTWEDDLDNWVPVNEGLPKDFELVDLKVFQDSFYSAIRGNDGGLYRFDVGSEVWSKVGPPSSGYGIGSLFVVGSGEKQKLLTYREDTVREWTGSEWKSLPKSPERLSGLATHVFVDDRFYASSHRDRKVRIFEFDFNNGEEGAWTEKGANESHGLTYAPTQHSNLVLAGDGNLFFTYTWRGRDKGNVGSESDPNYVEAVWRSTNGGASFADVTQNPNGSRGVHLGNMTNGINPGPFGSLRSVRSQSGSSTITEDFAATEQGVFYRNFNSGDNNQGEWQQIFRYWGNRGLNSTASGDKLILSGSGGVDIWDNEVSLGTMRRLTKMAIGQESTYGCRWNRIRHINSADSKKYLAHLEVGNRNCDRDKNIRIGMVRLNIDPDKAKASYNLDLDFAGYRDRSGLAVGNGHMVSKGLASLAGGRFALAFNVDGRGYVEIRSNGGKDLVQTIDLGSAIHDAKSPSEHSEFVVTGDFGTRVYKADGSLARDLGQKGNRVSMNRAGRVGIVENRGEATYGVYSFSPTGSLESERIARRSYVEDIAVSNTDDLIAISGFDNKRRNGVPVQVAFVTGHRATNLSQQLWMTWGHSGDAMGNDMADTRIYKMTFGDNDKLYVMGETAGGNTVFRWNGKDFGTRTLVSYDIYNDAFQTRDEHKLYYAIINSSNGNVERGQMTFPRTSSYDGNTKKAQDGSLYVDSRGVVYIGAGTTAATIEGRNLKRFNNGTTAVGTYSDGDTAILIVSPDFRERMVWTAFARPEGSAGGPGGTGSGVPGRGLVTGIAINNGKVGILASAVYNGRLVSHGTASVAGFQEDPPGATPTGEIERPMNLYFSVFGIPR